MDLEIEKPHKVYNMSRVLQDTFSQYQNLFCNFQRVRECWCSLKTGESKKNTFRIMRENMKISSSASCAWLLSQESGLSVC